jgi:hypothetical protein
LIYRKRLLLQNGGPALNINGIPPATVPTKKKLIWIPNVSIKKLINLYKVKTPTIAPPPASRRNKKFSNMKSSLKTTLTIITPVQMV